MKEVLTTNWSFIRALRLGLGIAFMISAYKQLDIIPAFIGGLFIYQSIMNIGCLGGACAVPTRTKQQLIEDTQYEEIK
jgi:hypothetical protein